MVKYADEIYKITMSKDLASLPSSAAKLADANSVTNAALIWNTNFPVYICTK